MSHETWLSQPENALISVDQNNFNFRAAVAGKSKETQRKYADWISAFYRDVVGISVLDLESLPISPFVSALTPAAVEAWLGMYAANGHSKSGLGQARAAIVFMARMLVLSKQAPSVLWHDLQLVSLPDNATSAAYGESSGRHGARWLAPEEVRVLISTLQAQDVTHQVRAKRDVSLIWLMVTLGLRRDEVAGLMWENLTRRGREWALRIRGKRNKWRAVGVPPETIMALEPWAALLSSGAKTLPEGYLLRRVRKDNKFTHEKITGNAVWRIVTDAWRMTGLTGHLAPHDLRRTAAAIALEAGATDREIQQMLGHSSIETTHRYLAPMRENTATYKIASLLSQPDKGFFG